MAKSKPLPPKIVDEFAHKAAKIADPHDKPRILDIKLDDSGGGPDSKTVDPETLAVHRTFRDPTQAYNAYKRLKDDNIDRNKKNALYQKKLNNEPPWKGKVLGDMGQNWRSNRPSGFMSTMISRIQPPFRQVVEDAPTLTYSTYPIPTSGAENKTKVFREEVTRCIRDWPAWGDIVAQTTHENTAFGYCNWLWDDLRDWKPEFCRQDDAFFSVETPQENNAAPIWARKKRYQIADLLPMLERPYLSTAAGWNIPNLVKAINAAAPVGRTLDSDEDARREQDWLREGSYGSTYESTAKYVELGVVFNKEPTGKISRYIFGDKDGNEICTQLDRFNNMSECLNLFAVEVGSGSLMSSRGACRDLYNTHIQIDRARNLVVDNSYLNGLLMVKKTAAAKPGVLPLTVLHPVCIVSEGFELQTQSVPGNVDVFLKLDQFVSGLAEIQLGTFLPSAPTGQKQSKKTASEINRQASIENQLRQGILMRWSRQIANGINRMQRGICHPEHVGAAEEIHDKIELVKKGDPALGISPEPEAIWARREIVDAFDRSFLDLPPFMVPYEVPSHLDEDAVFACLNMLQRGLTKADILLLAFSSSNEVLPDKTQQEAQATANIVARYKGNPSIDQEKLTFLDISKALGDEQAKDLILPGKDVKANELEAAREQTEELTTIMTGAHVDVSPRDNHIIHLQVMTQKLLPVIQAAPEGAVPPELANQLGSAMSHYVEHINQAEAQGADKALIAQYRKAAMEAHNHLTKGMHVPPHPGLMPAAARVKGGGKKGKGKAPKEAPAPEPAPGAGNSQDAQVNGAADLPKPPTAAT